ncbi:hypothetical protein D3C81_1464790 [compost metagenome]
MKPVQLKPSGSRATSPSASAGSTASGTQPITTATVTRPYSGNDRYNAHLKLRCIQSWPRIASTAAGMVTATAITAGLKPNSVCSPCIISTRLTMLKPANTNSVASSTRITPR